MKEMQPSDSYEFLKYLKAKNTRIYFIIEMHTSTPGKVVREQPKTMSNEDYKEYKRLLDQWLVAYDFY